MAYRVQDYNSKPYITVPLAGAGLNTHLGQVVQRVEALQRVGADERRVGAAHVHGGAVRGDCGRALAGNQVQASKAVERRDGLRGRGELRVW